MATWTKQEPQGSSNRRKWNLEGIIAGKRTQVYRYLRSTSNTFVVYILDRTSLRNLRNSLAEDGGSEVQYEIARQILEDNNSGMPFEKSICLFSKKENNLKKCKI